MFESFFMIYVSYERIYDQVDAFDGAPGFSLSIPQQWSDT